MVPLIVSPVFVMTYPDLGLVCAIAIIAETANKAKKTNFLICDISKLLSCFLSYKKYIQMQKYKLLLIQARKQGKNRKNILKFRELSFA